MGLFYNPRFRALDSNGQPLSGATLTFYRAGTTTPANIYRDADLAIPASNPTTGTDASDASGWFRQFFADENTLCDVTLKDADGVTIQTFVDVPFVGASPNTRERLTANRTYYVATTGSDVSNDGLTDGSPFLTVQRALDATERLDFNGFTVTVQIADGTYADRFIIPICTGQKDPQNLMIRGNVSTPANVVMSFAGAGLATIATFSGSRARVSGMKLTGGATSFGISSRGYIEFSDLDFGTHNAHLLCQYGGTIAAVGNYSISGGGQSHIRADANGLIRVDERTVTITGTPAFGTAFANATQTGVITCRLMTFVGSATGPRYTATLNGVIYTEGASATYLPGNAAGSTATGGQYG
ncbi:hypothetical protein [Phenylobacterium deserti]|uniref:Uncharacterized protein n=1 Tax=Phenylobacterium deserti TaxID=1914756 RepID=A0A328ABG8_9CAUL|nr:hypothetical protein [Phenylobacterium deserti]RAK52143.1 hypothetical protein DJ018_13385 [Phenylobacterium deserti]